MVSRRHWASLLLPAMAAAAAKEASAFAFSQSSQLLRSVSSLPSSPLATFRSAVAPPTTRSTTAANAAAGGSSYTLEGEAIDGPLQPLRGMVLLKKLEAETKTKGGLLLPTDSRKEQVIGQVIAVGPGEYQAETGKRRPIDVKAGDLVAYPKHSGETLKYNNADCVLLGGDDILARVADPEGLSPESVSPLGDTLFVRLLKPAEKTAGGLLLVSQQQERMLQQAVVVAAGPGRLSKDLLRAPMEVAVGDRILYSSYAEETSQLKVGDAVYAFVRGAEVAAKW